MAFPCFNDNCYHNEKSDSGCKEYSRFSVDLCDAFLSKSSKFETVRLESALKEIINKYDPTRPEEMLRIAKKALR